MNSTDRGSDETMPNSNIGEHPKVTEAFNDYREAYSTREPDLTRLRFDDELAALQTEQGLIAFPLAPITDIVLGRPPKADGESQDTKYLWVVMRDLVPAALENGSERRKMFKRGYLAHTNLTAGAPAYCGGEMWFVDDSTIVIDGGSGRYAPRSIKELEDVASAMKECGYRVAHMGLDETGKFSRLLVGDLEWL